MTTRDINILIEVVRFIKVLEHFSQGGLIVGLLIQLVITNQIVEDDLEFCFVLIQMIVNVIKSRFN